VRLNTKRDKLVEVNLNQMQPSTSDCCPPGLERINQFALVSYLPDPLGKFLDDLRRHLVPDCKPHAHVTILPPRPLCGAPEEAARELRELSRDFDPFSIRLGAVTKFQETDVVYIELASGSDKLRAMYNKMNRGASLYCERYQYSPHITLAQNIPHETVDRIFEEAKIAWRACPYDRFFDVEELSFVQNTTTCQWIDLETFPLHPQVPIGVATRKVRAVHHQHRA